MSDTDSRGPKFDLPLGWGCRVVSLNKTQYLSRVLLDTQENVSSKMSEKILNGTTLNL